MEKLAELIGMTEQALQELFMTYVGKAMSIGFTELEAKEIVKDTFRKQLGLNTVA